MEVRFLPPEPHALRAQSAEHLSRKQAVPVRSRMRAPGRDRPHRPAARMPGLQPGDASSILAGGALRVCSKSGDCGRSKPGTPRFDSERARRPIASRGRYSSGRRAGCDPAEAGSIPVRPPGTWPCKAHTQRCSSASDELWELVRRVRIPYTSALPTRVPSSLPAYASGEAARLSIE